MSLFESPSTRAKTISRSRLVSEFMGFPCLWCWLESFSCSPKRNLLRKNMTTSYDFFHRYILR